MTASTLRGEPDLRAIARQGLLESYRAAGTTAWLEAHGSSMAPLIPAGSRLLVEFGPEPARVGEVIVFRRGERHLAHRLVATRTSGSGPVVIAKGDHEAFLDPAMSPRDVLGIVRRVVRPDGRDAASALGSGWSPALARVSWWGGRLAGVAARRIRHSPLPHPIGEAALGAALALSRVPTRVSTAIMPRVTRGRQAGRR